MSIMLAPGDAAPSFTLPATEPGQFVTDPWSEASGPTVLAFFKVTCPTCMVAAPKVQALADNGARVLAIGQDPAAALTAYAAKFGQQVPTAADTAPYPVSDSFGIHHVPTLFLIAPDGTVVDVVGGWDREGWNRVAVAAGGRPVSSAADGLPSFRPG